MKKTLDTLLTECESGNRILAHGVTVSNDSHRTRLNNHDLIIGGSGSGKTTGYVCPNLNNPHGSIVVSDTKGRLYKLYASSLRKKGYTVRVIDFISPKKSEGYNPLSYIRRDSDGSLVEADIKKLAAIIAPSLDQYEPFWDYASQRYISMLIGYVLEALPEDEHTMMNVVRLHQEFLAGPGRELFESLSEANPDSYAARKYKMLKKASDAERTWASIMEFVNSALDCFDCNDFRSIFENSNTINLHSIGRKKTAVFLNSSDNDTSYHILCNIFNAQLIQVLIEDADKTRDGRLPVPTRIILDDFAASAKIDNFDKYISILRSRDISVSIILQSISQIENMYGHSNATTIMNNCDHILYLGGGNDLETADFIANHINRTRNTVLGLDNDSAILITRGRPSEVVEKVKPSHPETGLCREHGEEPA